MCTSIVLKSSSETYLLARTMDFSFELDPKMVIYPRNYPLQFHHEPMSLKQHYAFMGLSKNVGFYTLADGVNEHGFSIAALYFEDYAHYKKEGKPGLSIAPVEVVMWMLAQCRNTKEAIEFFKSHSIVDTKVDFLGVTPPLHWVLQDSKGHSVIVEKMADGLHIHDNTLGVLTNSPDYNWHKTNVRNYIGLHPEQVSPRTLYGEEFKAFGQGSGTFGLPGDLTPPSRFIRTLYNKLSSAPSSDLLIQAAHILNNVDIPKGSVVTQRNTIDYTQYTSYIQNNDLIYSYRLYDDLNTHSFNLNDFELDGVQLITKGD